MHITEIKKKMPFLDVDATHCQLENQISTQVNKLKFKPQEAKIFFILQNSIRPILIKS